MDKARYETIFMDFADTKPTQMRINNLELELLLRQEFLLREIRIPFEFRVFEGNQATVVGSENYLSTLNERQFKTPLFIRDDEYPFEIGSSIESSITSLKLNIALFIGSKGSSSEECALLVVVNNMKISVNIDKIENE